MTIIDIDIKGVRFRIITESGRYNYLINDELVNHDIYMAALETVKTAIAANVF